MGKKKGKSDKFTNAGALNLPASIAVRWLIEKDGNGSRNVLVAERSPDDFAEFGEQHRVGVYLLVETLTVETVAHYSKRIRYDATKTKT